MSVFYGNQNITILKNRIETCVTRPFCENSVRAFGRWIQDQDWKDVYDCTGTQMKTDALYRVLTPVFMFTN